MFRNTNVLRLAFYCQIKSKLIHIMYEKIFVNKDSQMLIHFSKTKMKSRGYIETVENKMSKQLLNQVKLLTNEELDAEIFRLNES